MRVSECVCVCEKERERERGMRREEEMEREAESTRGESPFTLRHRSCHTLYTPISLVQGSQNNRTCQIHHVCLCLCLEAVSSRLEALSGVQKATASTAFLYQQPGTQKLLEQPVIKVFHSFLSA